MLRRVLVVAALPLFVACGGGSSVAPSVPGGPSQSALAHATLQIVVPGPGAQMSARLRHVLSVSSSTQGLSVNVYTHPRASNPTPIATSAISLASGASNCTTTATGRTCTVSIPAPAGNDDITFASYDAAPVAGVIPGTAKQLGYAETDAVTITLGASNIVPISIGGIIARTALSLPITTLHAADGLTQVATVAALDADNNLIVSDNYVDASGNPVTIALSASGSGSSYLTLNPTSLFAPTSSGVRVTYTPPAFTSVFDGSAWSALLLATPSTSLGASTLGITAPAMIAEYTIPTAGALPYGIATGPDGNLWFTETSGNKIGKITPSGTFTEYTIPTSGSSPYGITSGPDGNLWFTESMGNKIANITTAGVITEYPVPTLSSSPIGIASGPDGNLWFTESNSDKIGKITTAGVITEYSVPTGSARPNGIATGNDGNVWFTELNGNNIGKSTTTGVITEYPIPLLNEQPYGITPGPDGDEWFTENTGNKVGKITSPGFITEYSVPTANSSPYGIITGPDSNLWFVENGAGNIGRITTLGAITEYPLLTGGAPVNITSGPDGNVWFTQPSGNAIGRLQL